jgi:uncharacterized membrane protein
MAELKARAHIFVYGESFALTIWNSLVPAASHRIHNHPFQWVSVQPQPETKQHAVIVKTIVASVVVVATNVVGNYALSRGMHQVGEIESWSPMPYIHAFAHPWVAVGVVFMLAWLVSRLALLSWADLSYVVPVTSFSYVLSALAAQAYLGEHVKPLRWAGIAVITLGVALVALTYPETPELYHEAPADDEPGRRA